MKKVLNYISLFSSSGVGCYGFKTNGFKCVATNELVNRRLEIQKVNKKCSYEKGYISGDITLPEVKEKLFEAIDEFYKKENVNEIDVVIATPPCQGMSVANHKKSDDEIVRNSLVVEAIKLVKEIKPKFFIFENVKAFMNTKCYENGEVKKIRDSIYENLSEDYAYINEIINFKEYGANSSRTRTLVIGVRKDIENIVNPFELMPDREEEKTLRDVIFELPRLNEMGEVSDTDLLHGFKKYPQHMRLWIKELDEGESAFDNEDIEKKPHKVVDGNIIVNVNKNGDKYKRQYWDKVAPCIHTRNDILSSQNTVHPEDDRVFSIREIMKLMNIPESFKWFDEDLNELNNLSIQEKQQFLKKHEMNIRQSIGEAIPTVIIEKIAKNIKEVCMKENVEKNNVS